MIFFFFKCYGRIDGAIGAARCKDFSRFHFWSRSFLESLYKHLRS